jgi:hypothetical protein
MAGARRKVGGMMAGAKKGNGLGGKIVGALTTSAVNYAFSTESFDKMAHWLFEQHFSEKFIGLAQKVHMPAGRKPLERISCQCDAVEELIATKADDLADDAPISQWRDELGKIRRGVELVSGMPDKDHRKIRSLQLRAKKLFDSAFKAAVD